VGEWLYYNLGGYNVGRSSNMLKCEAVLSICYLVRWKVELAPAIDLSALQQVYSGSATTRLARHS